jgi:hypothetical protein
MERDDMDTDGDARAIGAEEEPMADAYKQSGAVILPIESKKSTRQTTVTFSYEPRVRASVTPGLSIRCTRTSLRCRLHLPQKPQLPRRSSVKDPNPCDSRECLVQDDWTLTSQGMSQWRMAGGSLAERRDAHQRGADRCE